ncbi:MAG TPA: hypothetical protein DDW87_05100, partial [Firmicutes bacterium]|nr:hypothetical protein [Bacillota bacterium]
MWVNREFVVDHTPYNRNNPQPVTVVAQLKTGWNQIVMRYDDLAERDTVYGFRLQYLGDGELKMGIPAGSASIQDVLAVEKALDNSSFPRDTFREGLVSLEVCNPLNTDLL